jgi:hypothetical protein
MNAEAGGGTRPGLRLGGDTVDVLAIEEFLLADERRLTTFVTNFGDWRLPPRAAEALASPVAHLEWFHDTGELVAIGGVPRRGEAIVPLPTAEGLLEEVTDVLAGPGGAPGAALPAPPELGVGVVREFPAMVAPEGARVAVLAVIKQGPRVHELLWGWHRRHRDDDGWAWLLERLDARLR